MAVKLILHPQDEMEMMVKALPVMEMYRKAHVLQLRLMLTIHPVDKVKENVSVLKAKYYGARRGINSLN